MPASRPDRPRARGQVLVIFTLTIFVFIGLCAVVVDIAWYWANNLRIQDPAGRGRSRPGRRRPPAG